MSIAVNPENAEKNLRWLVQLVVLGPRLLHIEEDGSRTAHLDLYVRCRDIVNCPGAAGKPRASIRQCEGQK